MTVGVLLSHLSLVTIFGITEVLSYFAQRAVPSLHDEICTASITFMKYLFSDSIARKDEALISSCPRATKEGYF